jgi:DNA-binding CsgD family transcriptional regulator
MERDRAAALSNFVRFLSGNPDGDAAARTMVLGGLSPFGFIAGQIYAMGSAEHLELVGNFGYPDADAAAFRRIAISVPLPICDAFTSARTIAIDSETISEHYPLVAENTQAEDEPGMALTRVVSVPTMWSETPIGVLSLLQERGTTLDADQAFHVEAVASAVAMWLNNQRPALIEHWKRAAPLPHREFTLSDRQRKILFMIGDNFTNNEIARKLGYSIPTVKKDLQEIMRMLGTQDRRTTAGRARELGLLPDRRAPREIPV